MDIFKWIAGPLIAFLTAICLYLMKVVVEFPEKYVQKTDFHPDSYMFKMDCQREAGIKCLTIDEWYKGLTDPRYRSIPLSRTEV